MRGRARARVCGLALGVVLGAALLGRPAWAEKPPSPVTGVGEIIYHEGEVEAFGDGPDVLNLSIGAFDAFKTDPAAGEFRFEYRWGRKLLVFGPLVGLMANTKGGVFGYGGLYLDLQFDRLVVTPSAGLGGYRRGEGKRLGGTFEFHLGLDFAYRFDDGTRLGVRVTHISNAYAHDINPGEESALVTYTIPVGNMF